MSVRVHVICQNDAIHAVVLGSEEFAKQETERQKELFSKRCPWIKPEEMRFGYWHYHTVELVEEPKTLQTLQDAIMARSKQVCASRGEDVQLTEQQSKAIEEASSGAPCKVKTRELISRRCVNKCNLDEVNQRCTGCNRHIREIRGERTR